MYVSDLHVEQFSRGPEHVVVCVRVDMRACVYRCGSVGALGLEGHLIAQPPIHTCSRP